MGRHVALLTLGSFSALLGAAATADPIVLDASADVTLNERRPDHNDGVGGQVVVGEGFRDSSGLFKFDLDSAVTPGLQIQSADFLLTIAGASGIAPDDALTVNFYEVLKPWSEGASTGGPSDPVASTGEVTWNSQSHNETLWGEPGLEAGVDYAALPFLSVDYTQASGLLTTSFDGATDLLQQWLENPSTNYGFIMVAEAGGQYNFQSVEGASPSFRPRLSLTVVPDPASLMLAGAGDAAAVAASTVVPKLSVQRPVMFLNHRIT